mgnify:CR=1 FL=1
MPDEQNITHSYIIDFVRENLKKSEGILYELEDFAHKNEVPIVQKEVSAFLEVICRIHKPVKVLEVGCAIGYSAILMAKNLPQNAHVTTIERDEKMAELARQNFKRAGMEDKIDILEADAEVLLEAMDEKYDMIFMDASKAHYIHFLPQCVRMLNVGGLLISDNILYAGMVANNDLLIRRKITIVKRLREYIKKICAAPYFKTSILSIGDGIGLCYKLCEKE